MREAAGRLQFDPRRASTADDVRRFRVVGNTRIAPFITELAMEPVDGGPFVFTPGDYLRLAIPPYARLAFADLDVPQSFAAEWNDPVLRAMVAGNAQEVRRNYSLAIAPHEGRQLRFNVRLAVPAIGTAHAPGAGSAWVWGLKPGDEVTAAGPFGDFRIKPGNGEMVYIGGGAGMAPLRSHLVHLLEHEGCARRISFWYGARSRRDLFYQEEFASLARRFPNFSFHVALSQALPEDAWTGATGFIHEVVGRELLAGHGDPTAADYYLCGPPVMIRAVQDLLQGHGVARQAIAFDEF